jgi:hypothetical protein
MLTYSSGHPSERPVQPEIPRSHFARGMARGPYPEELPLGRFSEGVEVMPTSPDHDHRGRFSQGQEQTGEADPQKHIRRRYSEGLEHHTSIG